MILSEFFVETALPAIAILLPLMFLVFVIYSYQRSLKNIEKTQNKLSDKEFLKLFEQEPDGYLSVKRLMQKTTLSKSEARFRLQHFSYLGLIKTLYTSRLKTFYSLSVPIEKKEAPELSNKPFLTVEDILKLFKTFNFTLSLQNLCIATGLPVSILKREMKYFRKENIIEEISDYSNDGMSYKKRWVLREPYRSNPDQFFAMEEKMNLELEKIVQHRSSDLID